MTFILVLVKLQMKLELTVQNKETQSFMTHWGLGSLTVKLILRAYLAVITLTKQWNLSHKVNQQVAFFIVDHNILLMLFPLLRNTQTLMKQNYLQVRKINNSQESQLIFILIRMVPLICFLDYMVSREHWMQKVIH